MTAYVATRPDSPSRPLPVDPALRDAVTLLEQAAAELLLDEGRMGSWRFLGTVLSARKALANHATACASSRGPLAHIEDARPRLHNRVHRCLAEHDRLLRMVDGLITQARSAGPDLDAAPLRRRALNCAVAAAGHGRRVRATVFEWAYRDIGGEAG
jgi:hypothetical protein